MVREWVLRDFEDFDVWWDMARGDGRNNLSNIDNGTHCRWPVHLLRPLAQNYSGLQPHRGRTFQTPHARERP